jgi:hypothetical protein
VNAKLKSIIQYTIIAAIGAFFLYFAFKGQDWNELFEKIAHANFMWLGLGMAVSLFSHYLRAYRAILLYEPLGYKVSALHSFYAVIIGYMMNYFIPRGGELSRCAALYKTDNVPVDKSLGTVVTERIVDLFFMLALLGLIFLIQFDLLYNFIQEYLQKNQGAASSGLPIKWILLGGFVIIILVLFVFRNKIMQHPLVQKVLHFLKGFSDGLLSIKQVKSPVIFILLSIGIWSCYVLMMYFCLFAMDATKELSFTACLTVFAIGTIGVALPAPGAGAGSYHFFVAQALLIFGVAFNDGTAYATMVHGVQMLMLLLLGGIISVLVLNKQKAKS